MDTSLAELQIRNSCTKVTVFLTFIKHVYRFDFFPSNIKTTQITPKINPSLAFGHTVNSSLFLRRNEIR